MALRPASPSWASSHSLHEWLNTSGLLLLGIYCIFVSIGLPHV